jgi:hypothetical protein
LQWQTGPSHVVTGRPGASSLTDAHLILPGRLWQVALPPVLALKRQAALDSFHIMM